MPRDQRTYITIHDGMPDHPKIEPLSDAAFRLWVETLCWCSRHLTDGKIPPTSWVKRGTAKTRQELVISGLVEMVGEQWYCHDYTEHQRTAEEVALLREKRADAGRRGGLAKAAAQQASSKAVASASPVAKQTPSKLVAESETDTEQLLKDSSSEVASDPDDNPRADVKELCEHLAAAILKNGNKEPNVGKRWYRACRLLIDTDGHSAENVRKAIDWSQADPFWSTTVLSMQKLREKYDTLRGQASLAKTGTPMRPVQAVPAYVDNGPADPDTLPWQTGAA